jgi:hypothetical protein
VTLCVALGLSGELEAAWVLEPGMTVELGAGWADGPVAKLNGELEIPLLAGPFFPVPDVGGSVSGAVGGDVTICLPSLTLDLGIRRCARGVCADDTRCDIRDIKGDCPKRSWRLVAAEFIDYPTLCC